MARSFSVGWLLRPLRTPAFILRHYVTFCNIQLATKMAAKPPPFLQPGSRRFI